MVESIRNRHRRFEFEGLLSVDEIPEPNERYRHHKGPMPNEWPISADDPELPLAIIEIQRRLTVPLLPHYWEHPAVLR